MEMKVKDLVQRLSEFPPDMRVLVQGYEGGFADISIVKQTQVEFNRYKNEWEGPHESEPDSKDSAVVIFRAPNPHAG